MGKWLDELKLLERDIDPVLKVLCRSVSTTWLRQRLPDDIIDQMSDGKVSMTVLRANIKAIIARETVIPLRQKKPETPIVPTDKTDKSP
jgi:hypothetical protein